jgi:cell division protein ZapB
MENDTFDDSEPLIEADDFGEMPDTVETPETSLAILAERVDQLAQWCERLAGENRSLREQTIELQTERDALREKNEQSRARIDAMIVRLKGLGLSS